MRGTGSGGKSLPVCVLAFCVRMRAAGAVNIGSPDIYDNG